MENGAVLIACDTAPGLSGSAVQGLPVVWVRSMALMTAVTLATSYDGWQEYVDQPVVRDRRSGRELPSREVTPRIFVRPSAELDAFLSAARGPLPGPLEGLQSDGGSSVPVGPLVAFIERDLIAVRSMTYRNPATILAFVGGIFATLATKLDALVDLPGYRDRVRASNRQKVSEAGVAIRKAEIESVLYMPPETYLDRRLAEGAPIQKVVEELEQAARKARSHDKDIEQARDLVALSLNTPPARDRAPEEWVRAWLQSTPERAVATSVVRTETDAYALRGLVALDSTIEALPDVGGGDRMFAPPE